MSNGEGPRQSSGIVLELKFEENGLAAELGELEKGFDGFRPDSDVELVAKRLSPRLCCGVTCGAADSAVDFVFLGGLLCFMF